MKVLMIGDIMGEPGRRSVARLLPKLIANHSIDVVVGNGENVAGGFGITPDLVDDLFDLGVSVITTGIMRGTRRKSSMCFLVNRVSCVLRIIPPECRAEAVMCLPRPAANRWVSCI